MTPCPRCNGPLACGWWCPACRLTKDRAAWLAFAEKPMEPHPVSHLLIVLCAVAFLLFVANEAIKASRENEEAYKVETGGREVLGESR